MMMTYFRIRVRLNVRTQIALVGKSLYASFEVTFERLLAGVRTYVTLKEPRSREGFAAVWTLTRLIVRANVHRKGWH